MAAGKLYSRTIWIPPGILLSEIVRKQFLPLAIGMLAAWIAPEVMKRVQPVLSALGNVMLTAILVLMLYKMGSTLKAITPLVLVTAFLIALGSMLAVRLLILGDAVVTQTMAVCNANRHVGLALLLSGEYLHARDALPAVACYALMAPLVMYGYLKVFPVKNLAAAAT